MNVTHKEPDAIARLALTPRRQSPEMAHLEWSDDNNAMLRPLYMVIVICGVMALMSILVHFG